MNEMIAFIGLGTMGAPMAQRLLQAGFQLLVYDRISAKMQQLARAGAVPSASAREAASRAAITISMLPQPSDTEAVVLGENGIISELGEGKIFIDMSTSSPALTRRICEKIEMQNGEMLDAPVSGGKNGAVKGTLTIMVGGREETFNRCKKLLKTLGKTIYYTGKAGNGHLFKLLNNLLYSINMCAAAEVLTLGEKLGIELAQMVDIFKNASASSYCLQEKAPQFILSGDFTAGLSTNLLLKDVELALEMGEDVECMQLFGKLSRRFLLLACNNGLGSEDNSSVIKLFRALADRKQGIG